MDKEPKARRSAGMRGSPAHAAPEHPPISSTPPEKPRPEPSTPVRISTSRFAKPKVLMGEVATQRGPEIGRQREAFRAFMLCAQLQPSQWARAAGVPANELLAFLTGKIRNLTPDTAAKLARAAKVAPDDMFR